MISRRLARVTDHDVPADGAGRDHRLVAWGDRIIRMPGQGSRRSFMVLPGRPRESPGPEHQRWRASPQNS
jgi:hypothetical protein